MERPQQVNKTLKYNPGEKSLKAPFTFNIDFTEKSYTEKIARHELSGCSMFMRSSFDEKENKLEYYRGKD